MISTIGSFVMALGMLVFVVNVVKTTRTGRAPATTRGSPTRSSGTRPRRRRRGTSTGSPTSRARGRCATCGAGSRRRGASRWATGRACTALAAVAGTGLAVVSGAAGWDTAHRLLAGARAAAARRAARDRLDVGAAPAAGGAGGARPLRARGAPDRADVHLVVAALAFAATALLAAQAFRGHVERAALRDYLTLTKPRVMSLLLLTGGRGVFVGARGVPALGRVRRDDGRPRARLRRRGGAQPLPRPRHRQADGLAHRAAPGRLGPRRARARARVRDRALGALVRAARLARQPADRAARARREPLLRARLHALAQALDAAEHRHRRRRRRRAAARRLRRRGRPSRLGGARDVRDRLPLDAAALLGARADDPGALRDARTCRCCRSSRGDRETARQIVLVHGRCWSRHARAGRASASSGSSTASPRSCSARCSLVARRSSCAARLDRGARSRLFHYSMLYLALLFVAMALDAVMSEMDRARSTERRSSRARTCAGAGRCFGALLRALRRHRSASALIYLWLSLALDGIFITELGGGAAGRPRGQGSLRHGRRADDVRLGGVRRPRAGRDGRGGAAARGGRLRERRQDEPARVRLRRHLAEPPLRHRPEPGAARAARRAARAAARRRRSPPASPTPRSAPTPAARSGSRRRAAGSSASSRPTGSCRSTASSRSRRASTTPGRWRATSRAASR